MSGELDGALNLRRLAVFLFFLLSLAPQNEEGKQEAANS
jgi:hypothetical protein